jgi:DNA polymerase-4
VSPDAASALAVRALLHADLDAFYASVEQRDDPALAGLPVVVGGSPEQRGVVAAASYEARAFGVRSAMSMRTALRLCPQAVRVPPRFSVYGDVSANVMAIFHDLTDLVEPLSLDEAYLDVTDAVESWADAVDLAQRLKGRVREEVGLTLSVGVATSKSVAKVASDLGKPDGLVVVQPGEEERFLAPLPVGKLWGIGPRSEERLRSLGVATIGQLAEVDARLLVQLFGRWGEQMAELARGVDQRTVTPNRDLKSVGRETTFSEDIAGLEQLREELGELCRGVADRLRRRDLRGRTVTLKVRRSDFSTRTRQVTLTQPVADERELRSVAERLLAAELQPEDRLRLLGVSVSGFADTGQLALFTLE